MHAALPRLMIPQIVQAARGGTWRMIPCIAYLYKDARLDIKSSHAAQDQFDVRGQVAGHWPRRRPKVLSS